VRVDGSVEITPNSSLVVSTGGVIVASQCLTISEGSVLTYEVDPNQLEANQTSIVLISESDCLTGTFASVSATSTDPCKTVEAIPLYTSHQVSVAFQVSENSACANIVEPGLSAGAIAGIVVGVAVGVVAALVVVGLIKLAQKRAAMRRRTEKISRQMSSPANAPV